MFDAGAIQAHLDVETSLFDRKLTAAEERVKRFERDGHKVRISAVFDNASLGRARQLFTQLDNQLSREAMQRLRSSPQGSVLGALNALFSPHPVTGGPSPSQSASGGLLGRMIQAPGGGLAGGGGNSSVILGQAAGTSGAARVRVDNIDALANAIGNQMPDTPSGPDPGTAQQAVNTRRAAEASERSAANSEDAARAAASAARDSSNSSRSLLSHFGGGGGGFALFGRGGGNGRSNVTGFLSAHAGPFTAGLAGGIGPGILGLNTRTAGIIGLGGTALGALPALVAAGGALGLAGVGASLVSSGAKALIGTKNVKGQPATQGPLYDQAQQVKKTLQDTLQQGAQGLAAPLEQAFSRIPRLLAGIGPALRSAFAGAGTLILPAVSGLSDLAHQVLPLLGSAFRSLAPLIRPLIDGLGGLLRGILPGLTTLLRAAAPAVHALAGGLADIGSGIGKMLTQFAPVIRQSSTILAALFDVISALFPIVGQLAGVFARALAPVFVQFAGIIKSLLPFLTTIGHVLASLAGAILGDLVSAFGALAQILVGIAPALNAFAKAFSQIFTVLENSGVFAVIGDALEALVKPLTTMINALLRGLTPILPPLINFLGQLSSILVAGLAQAIAALLPPLTRLALVVLKAIAQTLPILLPLFLDLTKILTAVFVRVVTDLSIALDRVIRAIPPSALKAIALGFVAIWTAVKAGGIISAVSNPVGLITIAVAALVVGIVELAKHWHEVWTNIKNWAHDAGQFLSHLFRTGIVQDILAVWSLGLVPLAEHWSTVWRNIQNWTRNFWNWLHQTFGTDIANFFTRTIPGWLGTLDRYWDSFWGGTERKFRGGLDWLHRVFGTDIANFLTRTVPGWFDTAVSRIGQFWGHIENVVKAPIKFIIDDVLDGLISVFDTITHAIGLGRPIPQVHPMGLAAGGRIPGYGGGDSRLALLEPGEAVVDKITANTPSFTAWAKMMGIPGYASGGKVGQNPPINPITARTGPGANIGGPAWGPLGGIVHKISDLGKITAAIATGNTTALMNAFSDLTGIHIPGAAGVLGQVLTAIPKMLVKDVVNWLIGQGGGASGSAIANYAMSWLGKVPYVWGGTAVPGGADCSGFVQNIYGHFGIHAPRTSEAQGGWVRRGPPVPGGLAFYHSPAGGPDPGHVAIIRSASQVISQGGGMGPQLIGLHALPLLFTGVPPGGLGSGGAGASSRGRMSSGQVAALWRQMGGPAWAAGNMARIAFAESGDDPSAIQKGQPPGLTGWGLYQITPTSGIVQNGAFGNLLNAANNTRAAISLFASSGYGPWASDPVGRALSQAPFGYASGGILREPVIGFGRSGRTYTFAEREAEVITPLSKAGRGAMIGNVFIQLPEGQTVARALSDLHFWLSVSQQQGYAGAVPGG